MRRATTAILLAALLLPPSSAGAGAAAERRATAGLRLPWRAAGLSERQAAAHLLDRLAFGARPGEIDSVLAQGLEVWVERQLRADLPEPTLAARLATLPALTMSAREIAETYPPGFAVRQLAIEEGVVTREEVAAAEAGDGDAGQRELRRRIQSWMRTKGLRPERELVAQSHAQKLLRAVYAENQLTEVLTDFWFNHFNVSTTDAPVRSYLLAYERDAIRPHVLGPFRELLGATARHPAMLLYLDNVQSVADPGRPTTMAGELGRRGLGGSGRQRPGGARGARAPRPERPDRPRGLNENYARELLELHTLGVDGGYTQEDVVGVARALTGWAFLPAGRRGDEAQRGLARAGRAGGLGFVREGDFVFRADAHDAGAKRVLGVALPAGRGIEDGEQVLDLVATHPSTARHLATKLAARFVADDPPADLVDRLAATFEGTGGDLSALLRTLVESPEFWSPAARTAKIKSPFELAVSALRALGAEVDNPFPTLEWISTMGQPLYACAAPTGYPDRADHWINTGALLARMNFGLGLGAGRIAGVRFELAGLAGGSAPESGEAALAACAPVLLPARDVAPTLAALAPLLTDPELGRKVGARAPTAKPGPWELDDPFADLEAMAGSGPAGGRPGAGGRERTFTEGLGLYPAARAMTAASEPPSLLAGAAGLLLGSPEFQRR